MLPKKVITKPVDRSAPKGSNPYWIATTPEYAPSAPPKPESAVGLPTQPGEPGTPPAPEPLWGAASRTAKK